MHRLLFILLLTSLFNGGWKFTFGDASDPAKDFGCGTEYFNYLTKVASIHNSGPYSKDFDDSNWEDVDLPHDWVVELGFDGAASHSHGYKTVGYKYPKTSVGWYRKMFTVPAEDEGKSVMLRFDGIFRDSRVWVNGFYCGGEPSGYATSVYDISDYLNYGGENLVCVRVDATLEEGWFYEGAGIYRDVYLITTGKTHVKPFGTFVKTSFSKGYRKAVVDVETEVVGNDDYTIRHTLFDADGNQVKTIKGGKSFKIKNPHLWSVDDPYLYTIKTQVLVNDAVTDEYTTTVGLRDALFDPDKGFFLNGENIKLKGVNMHQDLAGVGSAIPDSLMPYIIGRLKWMGCNAIRSSHNPMSPAMLDACDKAGMLVMDENRQFGSSEENYRLLAKLIKRDRNHPSVILWSLGNEEWGVEWTDKGSKITATMREWCHQLDPTRLMTVATSSGPNIVETADVAGYNYIKQNDVEGLKAKYPERISVGTEETTGCGTRGLYFPDGNPGHMVAGNIDPNAADSLRHSIERGWKFYAERDWAAGLFYWTGFDYRGEPNPLVFPATGSEFGIFDYCGFPKDEAYYLRSWWTNEKVLHAFPDWNLPGHEGDEVEVWVYSNAPEVELFANGVSLGRKQMPENGHLGWVTTYQPGTLKAIGYYEEGPMSYEYATPSAPADLRVDKQQFGDITVCEISVIDADGRFVSNANVPVTISTDGRILGVGNGDPAWQAQEKASTVKTFNGKAITYLQNAKNIEIKL